MDLNRLTNEVHERMLNGQPLEKVEAEVIEPAALDDDAKAALWLYARSYLPDPRARAGAAAMAAVLAQEGLAG